jgi:hypothetical protein
VDMEPQKGNVYMGCLGTYNPLPKALHGCDRRGCTSGGAEVWRRDGVQIGGAALETSLVKSQVDSANATRTEEGAAGSDRHGRRTRAVTDRC